MTAQPRSFEAAVRHDDQGTILDLWGELDIATAGAVDMATAAISDDPDGRIAIITNGLGFLDAAGLSSLVRLAVPHQSRGTRVVALGCTPLQQFLFGLTTIEVE